MNCEACGHENIDGARFCAGCGGLLPVETTGEDPLVGQVIGGRYRITRVLGEGGMGVVYEAEQQMGSTVRKVAVKTLHPHLSEDQSVLQRFHRECGTVAQLEHPNTIKFYDFGATTDGTLYIAMEFVRGTSLDQVIEQEGALHPDRTLKILKQICGALDEAHGQGIIHRDLKPENIILTNRAGEADSVKVLDFGIAARTESSDAKKEQKLTQQGMVLGTPPYMSPEQFTGKELDCRSDIYSLGVLAYELLTGKLPFEADTPWQWATQHMTAQPTPFEAAAPSTRVPAHMRSAIMRALSKDRDQRHASAQEFFGDLSGGGGLTINEPIPESFSSAGTAAMAAVPDFAQAAAAAPMALQPSGGPGMVPVGAGAALGPVHAVAPSPPHPRAGGGGKGLIIGLVVIGVVLAVAMVVVLLQTLKPEEDSDVALANPFSSSAGEITVAAEADGGAAASPTTAADPTAGLDPTPTAANTGTKPAPTSTGTTPTPTATSTSTAVPTATATSTAPKPVDGKAACRACISAADSGNILGAAGNYRTCTDAAMKADCSHKAKLRASAAATTAARGGNCPAAKAIVAAARGMGAGSPRLDRALAGTPCEG